MSIIRMSVDHVNDFELSLMALRIYCIAKYVIASTKETLPNRVVGFPMCSWAHVLRMRNREMSWSVPIRAILKRHSSIQHAFPCDVGTAKTILKRYE